MECVEEELSDAQKDFYTKKQKEFKVSTNFFVIFSFTITK